MPATLKLYLIPGSGTDRRMYAPQLDQIPDILVPEWLAPLSLKEPLASYAERLAKSIDTSAPFILGGVSLGGMIAQQMAISLKPEALILISTCSTSKALPWSRRLAGRLTRALPDALVRILFRALSRAVEKTSSRRRLVYAQMLREMPPRLVRWQSGAATEWVLKERLPMPVFQIHGEKDGIIPLKNVQPDKIVQNGGHLINATHEAEVNAFIRESLEKISRQTT